MRVIARSLWVGFLAPLGAVDVAISWTAATAINCRRRPRRSWGNAASADGPDGSAALRHGASEQRDQQLHQPGSGRGDRHHGTGHQRRRGLRPREVLPGFRLAHLRRVDRDRTEELPRGRPKHLVPVLNDNGTPGDPSTSHSSTTGSVATFPVRPPNLPLSDALYQGKVGDTDPWTARRAVAGAHRGRLRAER
jgi:hypothetical protein